MILAAHSYQMLWLKHGVQAQILSPLIYCSSCVTFEKMKFHGIKEYTTGISTRLSLSGAYTADRQTKALEPREYIVAVKERTFHKEHPEFI